MAPAIDRRNMKGVGKSVERQRARQRNHVTAIDETAPEPALAFRILVEVDARRVLIKPGGELMLRFLDRDAVHVIDGLARGVVGKAIPAAGESEVIGGGI